MTLTNGERFLTVAPSRPQVCPLNVMLDLRRQRVPGALVRGTLIPVSTTPTILVTATGRDSHRADIRTTIP
jgi:hypothetical protein